MTRGISVVDSSVVEKRRDGTGRKAGVGTKAAVRLQDCRHKSGSSSERMSMVYLSKGMR
jgi:hypothetical protein